jgi:hypothetical protein
MIMTRMGRAGRLAAMCAAALAVNACATLKVNSYLDRRADFSRYRSYAWERSDAFSTGDARLDNNRFFIDRVEAAGDGELRRRGLEKTEAANADVTIHIHARVDQQLDTTALDRQYGRCDTPDCWPMVYETGTLVIDIVDTRTRSLTWRGWAETGFDGVIDNQAWMEATIDKAVARILARLPAAAR